MNVFSRYAEYYDYFYRDKDYRREAEFTDSIIRKYRKNAAEILDLGCGTGRHAEQLAGYDYRVHGVDVSDIMLEQALARFARVSASNRLSASRGDMRTVRLDRVFDVVTTLFHVIDYQTTNEDLQAAFNTAHAHLKPGGLFFFDCWFGPAVLADRPLPRIREVREGSVTLTRIAEPTLLPTENCVDVRYLLWVQDEANSTLERIEETHRMRFLFSPEIEWLATRAGFSIVDSGQWLTGEKPSLDSWSVYYVLRHEG